MATVKKGLADTINVDEDQVDKYDDLGNLLCKWWCVATSLRTVSLFSPPPLPLHLFHPSLIPLTQFTALPPPAYAIATPGLDGTCHGNSDWKEEKFPVTRCAMFMGNKEPETRLMCQECFYHARTEASLVVRWGLWPFSRTSLSSHSLSPPVQYEGFKSVSVGDIPLKSCKCCRTMPKPKLVFPKSSKLML